MACKILRGVIEIPAGHPVEAEDKHAEIEQVESDEKDQPADFSLPFAVHPSEHLGEPVMECGQKRHPHSAEHDIVEMAHNKISAVQVQVCRKCADYEAGKTSYRKQENKGKRKEHRRIKLNRTLIQSRHPVQHFYPARHRNN